MRPCHHAEDGAEEADEETEATVKIASRLLTGSLVALVIAGCGAWLVNRESADAFWVFFLPGSLMLLPFLLVTGGVHGPLMSAYAWLLVSTNAVAYGCLTAIFLSRRSRPKKPNVWRPNSEA